MPIYNPLPTTTGATITRTISNDITIEADKTMLQRDPTIVSGATITIDLTGELKIL